MHFLGLNGMPRRIPDYPECFWEWNLLASFGSIITLQSTLYFLFLCFWAFYKEVLNPDMPEEVKILKNHNVDYIHFYRSSTGVSQFEHLVLQSYVDINKNPTNKHPSAI
jgi:heme/copper-type cytochrome/quinol oxidase subunit 1